MERSTVRKVIRAASLSLLLATATGVAGLEIVGASPAMAQPDAPGSNPAPGAFADPTDPPETPTAPTSTAAPAPGLPGGLPGGLGGVDPGKVIGGVGAP